MYPQESLMKELGIDMEEIGRRMAFVGFTESDTRLLSQMEGFVQGKAENLIVAFYQHLLTSEETRALLKDQATVERLMKSQKEYLSISSEATLMRPILRGGFGLGLSTTGSAWPLSGTSGHTAFMKTSSPP